MSHSIHIDSNLIPNKCALGHQSGEPINRSTSVVNSYSGSYIATANHRFSVGDLQMTMMDGSEEAMHAESAYFQLLQVACRYILNQNKLTLLDAFGNELLTFSGWNLW